MSDTHRVTHLTWPKVDELIASHTREHVSPELCAAPLVSVMVHTFRHAAFIAQCMDGVLMQKTSFPFEIVVGDDGSEDGAYEILLEYQRRHPDKIRLFHSTPNLGRFTGNGILNGIRSRRACRGKYIAFVEGDDYWTAPDKLEKQVSFLEENPEYTASIHDVEVIGSWNGDRLFHDFGDLEHIEFEDQLTVEAPLAFGSLIGRLGLIRNLPETYLSFPYADRFILSMFAFNGPVRRFPENMGTYRRHQGGLTSSTAFYSFPTLERIWRMYREQKNIFHPRGDAYFRLMMRLTMRKMIRSARKPNLDTRNLFKAAGMLIRMGPADIINVMREQLEERAAHKRSAKNT